MPAAHMTAPLQGWVASLPEELASFLAELPYTIAASETCRELHVCCCHGSCQRCLPPVPVAVTAFLVLLPRTALTCPPNPCPHHSPHPQLPAYGVIIVHAGLVPGVLLERQALYDLEKM